MAGLRVGTYDGPKVSPTLGPTVLRDTSQPDIGGHIAHGLGAVAELMQQEQNKLENAQLIEFQRKANDKLTELTLSAKQKPAETLVKPGADGESGLSPFESDWQDFMQGQMEGASNDRVKEAIRLHGLQMGGHLSNQLMGIQADAAQRYKQESYAASLSSSMRNLVADPTPANFDRNRAALEFTTRQMNQGKPAEFINEQVALVRSAARAEQLTALVETPGMWQFAKELLNDKTIDAEIVGDKDRAALKRARERWAVVAGSSAADDLFNAGLTKVAALKQAKELLGDDPHANDAFSKRLDHLLNAKHYDEQVALHKWDSLGNQFAADMHMSGRGYPSFNTMVTYLTSQGATRGEATAAATKWDAHMQAEQNHLRMLAEKKKTPAEINAMISTINMIKSNPERLASANLEVDYPDLAKNAPAGLWAELWHAQALLQKDPGFAKLTKEAVTKLQVTMAEKKFISSATPQIAAERDAVMRAKAALVTNLTARKRPGVGLTTEDVDAAINSSLREITVPGRWWGTNQTPFFMLPAERKNDAGETEYRQLDGSYSKTKPVGYTSAPIQEED